jgi:hypothetical protein
MSQYMQIDIRLLPFYEKGFKAHFPRLAAALEREKYLSPGEKEPSLYALVDLLHRMDVDPAVTSPVKEAVSPFLERLTTLREKARETLLARRLNDLDRLLYQLEDEFENLEASL